MSPGSPIARAASTVGLLAVLAGCAAGPGPMLQGGSSAPAVREGRPADSTRITFVPERVTLPGGHSAAVHPAQTVDGDLVVPANVDRVGWWDGSASAGDVFGTTVIAGHVDSATDGLGYFARLLSIRKGEQVTVRSGPHRLSYRVVSVRSVTKRALATSSSAFDQTGVHRLVLITCTGRFRPGRGYDNNLVVTAEPVGAAR